MSLRTRSVVFSLVFAGLAAFSANPASAAADSTWSFRVPVQLQSYSDADSDYSVVTDLTTTQTIIPNGIQSVGNATDSAGGNNLAFSITGAQYDSFAASPTVGVRVISLADAHLNQPYDNTVDRIATTYNIEVRLSGGSVNLYEADSAYSIYNSSADLENVGSSGFTQIYTSGDTTSSFAYLDSFGIPNAADGTDMIGQFLLNFTWSGYSPTDTLEFSLPDTGITSQEISIPEPASLSLLATPALLSLRRRRA